LYLSLSLISATAISIWGKRVEAALAELTHNSREGEEEDSRQRLRASFLWYVFLVFFFTLPLTLLWSATVLLQPTFLPKLVYQKVTNVKDFLTAKHGHWITMAALIWPGLHAATAFLCVFIISDFSRLPTFVLITGWTLMGSFLLYGLYLCCTGRGNTSTQQQEMRKANKEAWDRVLAARERWYIVQDLHG
jgi:hypothetical protein